MNLKYQIIIQYEVRANICIQPNETVNSISKYKSNKEYSAILVVSGVVIRPRVMFEGKTTGLCLFSFFLFFFFRYSESPTKTQLLRKKKKGNIGHIGKTELNREKLTKVIANEFPSEFQQHGLHPGL